MCEYRAERWVAAQQSLNASVDSNMLSAALKKLTDMAQRATLHEKKILLQRQKPLLQQCYKTFNSEIENATTVEGLIAAAQRSVTIDADAVRTPATRFPAPSNTRYLDRLLPYHHLKVRGKALLIFIANELKKPSSSPSMLKLGKLLSTTSPATVQPSAETLQSADWCTWALCLE
eukprot:TRINITY_DN136_c2_g1_i17.p1 TRINITY_DN136_c2_g1~~TRINITY_DN136_c2_g1_i17.p1  ORF type:complete len:175 (+),score=21.03 TRINITY_DN136_c2_g1_i17:1255-1779(+)